MKIYKENSAVVHGKNYKNLDLYHTMPFWLIKLNKYAIQLVDIYAKL